MYVQTYYRFSSMFQQDCTHFIIPEVDDWGKKLSTFLEIIYLNIVVAQTVFYVT